jgi:hypothetical protein
MAMTQKAETTKREIAREQQSQLKLNFPNN